MTTERKIYLILSPDHMEVYYNLALARQRVQRILETDWAHIEHFIKDVSTNQIDWVNPKDDDCISIHKLVITDS